MWVFSMEGLSIGHHCNEVLGPSPCLI
uniref:Uncharacterized protein n=1 Tax=Rhizophora mucronata TaxID=61149 RepID=A0A2P2P717_RHIMU